jgi:hypothetical protein
MKSKEVLFLTDVWGIYNKGKKENFVRYKIFLILPLLSVMIGCGSTVTDGDDSLNIEQINKVQEALKQEPSEDKTRTLPLSIQTVESSSDEGYGE